MGLAPLMVEEDLRDHQPDCQKQHHSPADWSRTHSWRWKERASCTCWNPARSLTGEYCQNAARGSAREKRLISAADR